MARTLPAEKRFLRLALAFIAYRISIILFAFLLIFGFQLWDTNVDFWVMVSIFVIWLVLDLQLFVIRRYDIAQWQGKVWEGLLDAIAITILIFAYDLHPGFPFIFIMVVTGFITYRTSLANTLAFSIPASIGYSARLGLSVFEDSSLLGQAIWLWGVLLIIELLLVLFAWRLHRERKRNISSISSHWSGGEGIDTYDPVQKDQFSLLRRAVMQTLDSIKDMIILYDLEGRLLAYNRAAALILGIGDNDLGRKNFLPTSQMGKDTFDVYLARVGRGETATYEQNVNFGNETLVFAFHLSPVTDENARTIALVSFSHDVTQYRQMEHDLLRYSLELEQLNQRFNDFLNNSPDGIYYADLDGKLTYANPALIRMLGYNRQSEVIGKEIGSSFWKDAEEREKLVRERQEKGVVKNYLADIKRADGSIIQFSISTTFTRDEEGNIVGVEGILRDITETTLAKQELMKRNQELETLRQIGVTLNSTLSINELKQVITNLAVKYTKTKECFVFTFREIRSGFNLQAVFKDKQDNLKNISLVQISEPHIYEISSSMDDVDKYENLSNYIILPLEIGVDRLGAMLLFAGKDDPFVETDVNFLTTFASHACLALFNSMLFEYQIQRAERYRAEDQAKTEFLNVLSHELRTPLMGILGYTEVLRLKGEGVFDESMIKVVDSTRSMGERMLNLTNQLLDMAKISTGKIALMSGDLPLEQVVNDVVLEIVPLANEKNLQIDISKMKSATVFADRDCLMQVLVNLLTNAIKFSPQNGTVTIDATEDENGMNMLLSVRDQGPGIPKEEQEAIFVKFYRSSDISSSGIGLGLSIAKQLMELMGGAIMLSSTLGEGSVFTMVIPKYSKKKKPD